MYSPAEAWHEAALWSMIARLCTVCGEVTTLGLKCALHRAKPRGSSGSRGYDAEWNRIRRLVLARDDYRCMIRGRRCTKVATTVDHIVPLSKGGARLDPRNLRGACSWCNTSLGARGSATTTI